MAVRLMLVSLFNGVALAMVVLVGGGSSHFANGTFTYPEDLHFEAKVPKSDLIASGNLRCKALPLVLANHNKMDRHPPTDASFYSTGFTDEHHQPQIDFSVENGALVKLSVSFPAPSTLAMPAFTIKIMSLRADHSLPTKYYRSKRQRAIAEELNEENDGLSFDERNYEMIMEETLVTPTAQSGAANFDLHDPTPMEDMYDFVIVILNVHPRVISSFVYELSGIPNELFNADKMYDLIPFNSTMHMKFVTKYDPKEDMLGIWVVRRPPVPDFTLLVSVEGKAEMTENVANPSPSGQGFPNAVPHAKVRKHASFRFVVHFYEKARQTHVCFPILEDFDNIVKERLEGSTAERKFVDEPIPTLKGFNLRFVNDNHRGSLTASLVQPHPISSFMLSLYASYNGDTAPLPLRSDSKKADVDADVFAERPILIFREEEHHVPYVKPSETGQFGWYGALPMDREALLRLADARATGKSSRDTSRKLLHPNDGEDDDMESDGVQQQGGEEEVALEPVDSSRLKTLHLSACVSFNSKEGEMHPFEEMADWVEDYGGNIRKLAVVTRVGGSFSAIRQGRHTKSKQGLAAREDVSQGGGLGVIPYRVLLTTATVEGNDWIREVMKNATAFVSMCVELGMDIQQSQHFMLMTLFMLMQPSSSFDGTNWRHYFDTIPIDEVPILPIFFSEKELAMFRFCPLMAEHIRTMKALVAAEYDTIAAQVPWFAGEVSREKYTVARCQVENRVFNISGNLIMIPALDYLGHAEDPTVTLSFNDKDQEVEMYARYNIPAGGPLTIDYGFQTRNQFDFLIHFGFIPNAAKVAAIRLRRRAVGADKFSNVYLLANYKDSRVELLTALREDIAAGKSDDEEDAVSPSMVTQSELRGALVAFLSKELQGIPPRGFLSTAQLLGLSSSAASQNFNNGGKIAADEISRANAIVELAGLLYEGHVLSLQKHLDWARDEKVPL